MKMNLDSCLEKFRSTVGQVVALEIEGPNDEGDYVITADSDTATLHSDGSFECESTTLSASMEKHFGAYRDWYTKNMAGPDDLPKGEDPEEVPAEPFRPAEKAVAPIKASKKAVAPRTFDARAMQIDNLTIEDVMADFQTDPPLTRQEAKKFILMCVAKKLNPYMPGEVYIVKYTSQKGDAKANIIIGKDAFLRKADEHPMYKGMKAGVVVIKEGKDEPVERIGTLVLPKEELIGGWAEIVRSDRDEPTKSVVSLAEYHAHNKTWNEKTATMIRKVAIVAALREAFAGDFGGMYSQEEMDQAFDPGKEIAVV